MSKTIQINPLNTEQPSLDKRIYKVKLLVNGSINTIYVFNGKKINEKEEELFKKIFSDEELEQIKTEKIIFKRLIIKNKSYGKFIRSRYNGVIY